MKRAKKTLWCNRCNGIGKHVAGCVNAPAPRCRLPHITPEQRAVLGAAERVVKWWEELDGDFNDGYADEARDLYRAVLAARRASGREK